ncbi:hypothetical protein R6Q57_019873 [Mikania cordata]
MALSGKLTGNVEISAGGKVLHDLLRHTPNDISSICPHKVHACDLQSGGKIDVGSTIVWHFTHDGKKKSSTELIEEIDEANHRVVKKLIAGDIIEGQYKSLTLTFHAEQKDGKQWGIWTMEFEKLNTSVPYPTSFMDYLCDIIKDMDDHSSSK